MANQNKLANWALSKKESLKLRFTQFHWPEKHSPGLYDFEAQISIGGKSFDGRGIALEPGLAIEKSICEAIERAVCLSLQMSSVGVAIAGSDGPDLHARNEVLERFFLNQHLKTRRPLSTIVANNELWSQVRQAEKFQQLHSPLGTKLSFYRMAVPHPFSGYVCCIEAPCGSKFPGFALGTSPSKELQRCFFEAIVNFATFFDEANDSLKSKGQNGQPWHIGSAFTENISSLFQTTHEETQPFPIPRLEKQMLSFEGLPELRDCPMAPPVRYVVISGD